MQQKVFHELSAGGVVVRERAGILHVALIKTRRARGLVWILPKGHVEPHKGETIAAAARREVIEEIGIRDVDVVTELGTALLVFRGEEGLIKKRVHYFLMRAKGHRLSVEQKKTGERILLAKWFPFEEALRVLTFPKDREIVQRVIKHIDKIVKDEAVRKQITSRHARVSRRPSPRAKGTSRTRRGEGKRRTPRIRV